MPEYMCDRNLQAVMEVCSTLYCIGLMAPPFRCRYKGLKTKFAGKKILSQEPCSELCSDDVSPDAPSEPEYSDLIPRDDVEKQIISAYNDLLRRRYTEEKQRCDRDYQENTMMLRYKVPRKTEDSADGSDESGSESGDCEVGPLERFPVELAQRGIVADVEDMGDGMLHINLG